MSRVSIIETESRFTRFARMPRFYFDARADHVFIEDDEGVELPDLTAVEREALEVVANIGRDKIRMGSCAVTI